MSNIVIVGASGFIGRNLAIALADAGHSITCGIRYLPLPRELRGFNSIKLDYTDKNFADDLEQNLLGIDVVINSVGILRENDAQSFSTLHQLGPQTLFSFCAAAGIRIIQISALGADENATTSYHRSKKAADDFLLSLTHDAVIVQPSLVYGTGGASAKLFNLIASLPVIPLPGNGNQTIQPIHIADLTSAIVTLVNQKEFHGQRVHLVGPTPLTLHEYFRELRRMLEFGPGRFIHIPLPLVELGARIGTTLPHALLDLDTWKMLKRGNTSNSSDTIKLLKHEPRAVRNFASSAEEAKNFRISALLSWLMLIIRLSLATVWLIAGIVSLGIYPIEESYELLERVGITGIFATWTLYSAATMDICFGLATLFLKQRQTLWIAQAMLIIVYTLVITIYLPEFWLHPFGPLVKNLPILALILVLYQLEKTDGLYHR
mgnify:FL=1